MPRIGVRKTVVGFAREQTAEKGVDVAAAVVDEERERTAKEEERFRIPRDDGLRGMFGRPTSSSLVRNWELGRGKCSM